MIQTILFNGIEYPQFQAQGFAAQFAIPFAKLVCVGEGYDIGCGKPEWAFPGAIKIDETFNDGYSAMNLPDRKVDYIFSSHCLEHLPNWVDALNYWYTKLVDGGVLFLYLPHPDQEYWRPWNNRKHIHSFYPSLIESYLRDKGYKKIFVSEQDLNNSFMVMAEKSAIGK